MKPSNGNGFNQRRPTWWSWSDYHQTLSHRGVVDKSNCFEFYQRNGWFAFQWCCTNSTAFVDIMVYYCWTSMDMQYGWDWCDWLRWKVSIWKWHTLGSMIEYCQIGPTLVNLMMSSQGVNLRAPGRVKLYAFFTIRDSTVHSSHPL